MMTQKLLNIAFTIGLILSMTIIIHSISQGMEVPTPAPPYVPYESEGFGPEDFSYGSARGAAAGSHQAANASAPAATKESVPAVGGSSSASVNSTQNVTKFESGFRTPTMVPTTLGHH